MAVCNRNCEHIQSCGLYVYRPYVVFDVPQIQPFGDSYRLFAIDNYFGETWKKATKRGTCQRLGFHRILRHVVLLYLSLSLRLDIYCVSNSCNRVDSPCGVNISQQLERKYIFSVINQATYYRNKEQPIVQLAEITNPGFIGMSSLMNEKNRIFLNKRKTSR